MRFQVLGLNLILFSWVLFCVSGCEQKSDAAPPPPQMVIPVVGFKAIKQPIAEKISLVGTLEANEMVEIKSEIDGAVEKIDFSEGQKVKKGTEILLIDQRKLKAALEQAQANLRFAETTTERYQPLIASGAVSRQEYDQAVASLEVNRADVELNKALLKDSTIVAPFDGVMGERKVSVGQFITKGTSISFLVSQDPMKANFRVPERYLNTVSVGQTVEMEVAAYPGEKFGGDVYFIDPKIDELSRTALVKAKVANPEGKLRHGMFANLKLIVNKKEDVIVVPEAALIPKGDDVQVYVVNADDSTVNKLVKVGIRMAGTVEILEGLSEGEIVIVEGHQKLGPGMKVSVRYEGEPAPVSPPEEATMGNGEGKS